MNERSTTHTFWTLIKTYDIIIPQLQRDYAQGRTDNMAIEQIRNALIAELYESLTKNKPLVLNFIYGETSRTDALNRFIPIDGQQRLTTLFLLHWYIFVRTGYEEGLEMLKKFSYKTRDTSRRFCKSLCECSVDLSKDSVEDQIKNCYWFTGNFENDPTIKSMLVMLDTIHQKFYSVIDCKAIRDMLISKDCPVSFLWLPMDNFQQTDDLYIKMNARGKLLSDFEIFKAKLQNSEILTEVLGDTASEKNKILFISKYNNQYAELFYGLFEGEFDAAMMDFFKEVIRDDYFCYVSESNVRQKEYRTYYNRIQAMNGSVFFRFIESGGFGFTECQYPEKVFVTAIRKADKLLEVFEKMPVILKFDNTLQKDYYDEKSLFMRNHKAPSLSDNVVRYTLYAYIFKFETSCIGAQWEGYSMWKRFVYNMVTNTDFGGRSEDACEAMLFFKNILNLITADDESSVLYAITNADSVKCSAALRYQLEEEMIKAMLINSDMAWRTEIFDAEDYFVDGQIGFLLEFSKIENHYDLNSFKEYYDLSKKLFLGNKRLLDSCDAVKFEQALLCMPDMTENKTAHLIKKPNSTTTWGFYRKDYKELLANSMERKKKNILKALLERLLYSKDINNELLTVIKNTDFRDFDSTSEWKKPFIENNLFEVSMGGYQFRNCIHLARGNREILMLAGTTVRAYSMELNTFLLYKELQTRKLSGLSLNLEPTAALVDSDNFPLRYIEYKGVLFGYTEDISDNTHSYICKGGTAPMTFEDVVTEVLKL